jgi:hypothetical protein
MRRMMIGALAAIEAKETKGEGRMRERRRERCDGRGGR